MRTIVVSKMDAARRQLRTAIGLWVVDGDPVSVHSLAYAAHQIVHDLNRKAKGPHLFLDMPDIRKDKRDEFIRAVKRDANFFKHADARGKKEDPSEIEFAPDLNELFMVITITGLVFLNQKLTDYENGFLMWARVNRPELFDDDLRKRALETGESEVWQAMSKLPKREFLKVFKGLGVVDG